MYYQIPITEATQLKPLFDYQLEIINHPAKYKIGAAGRGGAKSYLGCNWLLSDAWLRSNGGNKYLIIATTKEQVKDVYWEQYLLPFAQQYPGLVNIRRKWWDASKLIIKTAKGDLIYLKSGNDVSKDALRGIRKVRRMLLDEVAWLSSDLWDGILRPMMLDYKDSAMLAISSPKGVYNLFHNLYRWGMEGRNGNPLYDNWMSWTWTTYKNPTIDHEELDKIKMQLGPNSIQWLSEYMGQFCAIEGAVFSNFDDKNITTKAVYDPNSVWDNYAWCDPGSNIGVTGYLQRHRLTGNWKVFDEYLNLGRGFLEEGRGTVSQGQDLYIKQDKYKIQQVFIDCASNAREISSGKTLANMLRETGIRNITPVPKTPNVDKFLYTEQIKRLVKGSDGQPHIFFHPDNTKHHIEMMYNLRYPDRTKYVNKLNEYVKDGLYDHAADAMRYAAKMLLGGVDNSCQVIKANLY